MMGAEVSAFWFVTQPRYRRPPPRHGPPRRSLPHRDSCPDRGGSHQPKLIIIVELRPSTDSHLVNPSPPAETRLGQAHRKRSFAMVTAKSPLDSSTSRQLRNSRSVRRKANASSSRPRPSSSPA